MVKFVIDFHFNLNFKFWFTLFNILVDDVLVLCSILSPKTKELPKYGKCIHTRN